MSMDRKLRVSIRALSLGCLAVGVIILWQETSLGGVVGVLLLTWGNNLTLWLGQTEGDA